MCAAKIFGQRAHSLPDNGCSLQPSEIQFFFQPFWNCSILGEVPSPAPSPSPSLIIRRLDQHSLCPPCAYLEKLSKPSTVVSLSRLRHHNSGHMTSVQTVHLSSLHSHFLAPHRLFPRKNPVFHLSKLSDHRACFHRSTVGCLPISSRPCPLQ